MLSSDSFENSFNNEVIGSARTKTKTPTGTARTSGPGTETAATMSMELNGEDIIYSIMLAWRWSEMKANLWFETNGPYRQGVVYIPSTASNQFEMWMDPMDWDTIEKELSWAQQLGFNSIRVFLHDQMYTHEKQHFIHKIDRFLDLCQLMEIKPVLVLLDSCWDPSPSYGPQLQPIQHVYSSRWVQSPGKSILQNETAQQLFLKPYIKAIASTFGNDNRVLMLDLWNDPFQSNRMLLEFMTRGMESIELSPIRKRKMVSVALKNVFRWARSVGQLDVPLTVGLSSGSSLEDSIIGAGEGWKFVLDHSDVISFRNLNEADDVLAQIDSLSVYGRPIILTEYLARERNSTIDPLLGELYQRNIWAFSKGLVEGKTQWKYPVDSWEEVYDDEPDVWSQDLLRKDGTPFFSHEVDYLLEYQSPSLSQSTPDFDSPSPVPTSSTFSLLLGPIKESSSSSNVIVILAVGFATAFFLLLALLLLLRLDQMRENTSSIQSEEEDQKEEEEANQASDESLLSPMVASCQRMYPRGRPLPEQIAKTILPDFPTLCSAIPITTDNRPALADISSPTCTPINHNQIRDFVMEAFGPALHRLGFGRGNRIALIMPDGPELALAILAVAAWATVVPLEVNDELENNLRRCRVDLVIGKCTSGPFSKPPESKYENKFHIESGTAKQELVDFMFDEVPSIADKVKIPYAELIASKFEAGMFRLIKSERSGDAVVSNAYSKRQSYQPNNLTSEALVIVQDDQLKVFSLGEIMLEVITISLKWKLTSQQTLFTLASLHDAGSVICQVFAPILSGGCVIASRDINNSVEVFWNFLNRHDTFTWYYASPKTHNLIVDNAPRLGWTFNWTKPWSGWNRKKNRVRVALNKIVSDEVQRKTRRVIRATFLSYIQIQPLSKQEMEASSLDASKSVFPTSDSNLELSDF